jgi:hypothetical protein
MFVNCRINAVKSLPEGIYAGDLYGFLAPNRATPYWYSQSFFGKKLDHRIPPIARAHLIKIGNLIDRGSFHEPGMKRRTVIRWVSRAWFVIPPQPLRISQNCAACTAGKRQIRATVAVEVRQQQVVQRQAHFRPWSTPHCSI